MLPGAVLYRRCPLNWVYLPFGPGRWCRRSRLALLFCCLIEEGSCTIPSTWRSPIARRRGGNLRAQREATLPSLPACRRVIALWEVGGMVHAWPLRTQPGRLSPLQLPPSRRPDRPARACPFAVGVRLLASEQAVAHAPHGRCDAPPETLQGRTAISTGNANFGSD